MANKNISLGKGVLFSVILIGLFFGSLELVARFMDGKNNYRYKLLQAIYSVETRIQPISHRGMKVPWPERSLYVRTYDQGVQEEPYVLGGRIIKDASEKQQQQFILPESVAPNKKKIFIVGGSAAFGFPYRYEDTFPHLLERKLGRQYQVINAAQVGWSSGEIAPIVKRIVDFYDVHTLVIFAGNNEWYHWVPENQPWANGTLMNTFKTLSHSRTLATVLYFGFKRASENQEKLRRNKSGFRIHEEIEGYQYAFKNPTENNSPFEAKEWMLTKGAFLKNFEENLFHMAEYARKKNIQVLLANVPFNHKLSPAWKHRQPTAFDPDNYEKVNLFLSKAVALIEKGQYENGLSLLEEAIFLEEKIPLFHYLKGFALEKLQQWKRAEDSYAMSREMMIGHLGSRLSTNQVIQKAAEKTGAELADIVLAFDRYERVKGSYFNTGLIDDDCHPTLKGHKIITDTLATLIRLRR